MRLPREVKEDAASVWLRLSVTPRTLKSRTRRRILFRCLGWMVGGLSCILALGTQRKVCAITDMDV